MLSRENVRSLRIGLASVITVLVLSAVVALLLHTSAQRASAGVTPTNSHLRVWSATPHGDHDDKVINNSIKVHVRAERECSPAPDEVDTGVFTLTPGNPSTFTWVSTPAMAPNGFFNNVGASAQDGGCSQGDVLEWLMGVQLQQGGACGPAGAGLPDRVVYSIDSDDLGNGKRYHASPASCSTTVTPVDKGYSATDLRPGFDFAPLASDNGVTIGLEYE